LTLVLLLEIDVLQPKPVSLNS